MRLLLALVVWIGAVAGAVALSSAVANSIHTTATTTTTGAGSSFDASAVKSTDPASLFRTANLTRLLSTARSKLGGDAQLDNFVIYPGYLSVTAVRAGTEINLYVDAEGSYDTSAGGSPGDTTLFPLARIDAAAPTALAQRIATSGGVPESQLHYMVAEIDPSSNRFRWLVYPLQGNRVEYFQAPGATGQLREYLAGSSTGLQPVGR
jgi:hypothetical protein